MDEFTEAYIAAALYYSNDDDDVSFDNDKYKGKLADETKAKMVKDCADFQAKLQLEPFTDDHRYDIEKDPDIAGSHFWLTRNGHGRGFWDGDWEEELGKKLTKLSKTFGEQNLYVGDDGLIYSM